MTKLFDFKKDYGNAEGIVHEKRNRLFHLVRAFFQKFEKINKDKEDANFIKEQMEWSIDYEDAYKSHLKYYKTKQENIKKLYKEIKKIKTLIKQHQQSIVDYTLKYKKNHTCFNELKKIAAIDLCSDEGWDEFNCEMRIFWECAF